jgi:DNA-binding FadR family transcriptional regulator
MAGEFKMTAVEQIPARELVVEQTGRAIILDRYLPVNELPAEPSTAGHFDLSRTSVREAIQIIVECGVFARKRGAVASRAMRDQITGTNHGILNQ